MTETTSLIDWIITGGIILAKVLIIVMPLMLGVAYLTYAERKIIGYMQLRIGPNRVGPKGWLQPIADGLKLFVKEDLVPGKELLYGQSITDACICWEDSEPVLEQLAEAVRARREGSQADQRQDKRHGQDEPPLPRREAQHAHRRISTACPGVREPRPVTTTSSPTNRESQGRAGASSRGAGVRTDFRGR